MPYHFSSAEYQPFASLVQSAVTTIAIILSSGAAIRGLNSWRRQLEANVNLEVKRALLPAVYRLRNALLGIRFPVIFGWEHAAARLSLSGVPTTSRDEELRAIWAARWKQVSDRIPDVESASVEA